MYDIVFETYLDIERKNQYDSIAEESFLDRIRVSLSKVKSSSAIMNFTNKICGELAYYEIVKPDIIKITNEVANYRINNPRILAFAGESGIVISYINELKNLKNTINTIKTQKMQYDILKQVANFIKQNGWMLTLNNITTDEFDRMKSEISTIAKIIHSANIIMGIEQALIPRFIVNSKYKKN